jgi:Domain of unknown function (DUF2828)
MDAIHNFAAHQSVPTQNSNPGDKMLTENNDLTYRISGSPLVDLFDELEENAYLGEKGKLDELIDKAWRADPLLALKVLFNARSIHLGKSSRNAFY